MEIISQENISIESISLMDNDLVWYENKENSKNKMFYLDAKDNNQKYEYYSTSDNENIHNLVDLTYVNIPSIMNVLNKRYTNDNIYTFNGNIVVSINPFKKIDAYSLNSSIDVSRPHVYSIAEIAYQNIYKKNQSILVSGESGSGKTENTKHILNYLCHKHSNDMQLSHKIIYSNYLIELFGNAKTIRNDNSSRFGKFIKLYTKNNIIVGADIENYLLEKLRVSYVTSLEKTYHIFYLVCTNSTVKTKYSFKDIEEYDILRNSNHGYVIDEFLNYNLLLEILYSFSFSIPEIDMIFYRIKIILELLNVYSKDALHQCLQDNLETLGFLNIDYEEVYYTLTKKVFEISGEKIEKRLDDNEIRVQIKSYCEDLYEEQFNIIINKLNLNLGEKTSLYISILDIFGFEIFQKNSYEQLCINYTNEILQQIYNEYIFQNEQTEYEKENIDWTKIDFKKNDDIISLFTGKISIFSIINEQSILGSGTNDRIFNSISKHLSGNLLSIDDSKRRDNIFKIKHYTGNVEYTIDSYIEKNRIKGKSSKIKTNLQYFNNQLNLLKNRLDENQCYFVRCIKPNDKNIPDYLDERKVYIQLLYSGIIEGIKIVLSGYPVKKNKEDLIQEFRFFNYYNKLNIIDYLENSVKDKKKYQIGINKVFLKKEVYEECLKTNTIYKHQVAIEIQKYINRIHKVNLFTKTKESILFIQNNIRCCLAKRIIEQRKIQNAQIHIKKAIHANIVRSGYRHKLAMYNHLTRYIENMKIQKSYKIQLNMDVAQKRIGLWFRRILVNRRIKDRKNVKLLANIVDKKNTIIKDKDSIIEKQNKKIEELMQILNRNDPVLSAKTNIDDNLDDTPDKSIQNFEKEYCIVDDVRSKSLNKDSKMKDSKIKDCIIKEDYFKSKSFQLDNSDNQILKEKKLEDIGSKMHNLYLELNSKEDDINLMNHKYQVLLLAYERERKKHGALGFLRNIFN